MKGFVSFIREQGVIGLAVGFILGGSVKEVVTSLITNIINPILGIFLGLATGFESAVIKLGPAQIQIGSFLSTLIDFIIVALVVYFGIKGLGLEKLDKKK